MEILSRSDETGYLRMSELADLRGDSHLLSTGIRRGELMGLQWGDLDLDAGKLRVERAIEKTKAHGLRMKAPKTRHGRRIDHPARYGG